MKLITENANHIAAYVGHAITKDPLSWNSWKLLHVESQNHLEGPLEECMIQGFKKSIQKNCRDISGITLFCDNGDILLLAKHINIIDLLECGNEIARALAERGCAPVHVNVWEATSDWQQIGSICNHYSPLIRRENFSNFMLAADHSDRFLYGDIAILEAALEQFADNRSLLRQSRNLPCVLLAEDDDMTRRIVAAVLKNQCQLITASTAEEAIMLYMLHTPDVLFLDINLPDHSGFSVLRSILHCDKDAYVVMFSGNGYADNMVDALNIGAQGFITKPFHKELLQHYIRDCDARRQAFV